MCAPRAAVVVAPLASFSRAFLPPCEGAVGGVLSFKTREIRGIRAYPRPPPPLAPSPWGEGRVEGRVDDARTIAENQSRRATLYWPPLLGERAGVRGLPRWPKHGTPHPGPLPKEREPDPPLAQRFIALSTGLARSLDFSVLRRESAIRALPRNKAATLQRANDARGRASLPSDPDFRKIPNLPVEGSNSMGNTRFKNVTRIAAVLVAAALTPEPASAGGSFDDGWNDASPSIYTAPVPAGYSVHGAYAYQFPTRTGTTPSRSWGSTSALPSLPDQPGSEVGYLRISPENRYSRRPALPLPPVTVNGVDPRGCTSFGFCLIWPGTLAPRSIRTLYQTLLRRSPIVMIRDV